MSCLIRARFWVLWLPVTKIFSGITLSISQILNIISCRLPFKKNWFTHLHTGTLNSWDMKTVFKISGQFLLLPVWWKIRGDVHSLFIGLNYQSISQCVFSFPVYAWKLLSCIIAIKTRLLASTFMYWFCEDWDVFQGRGSDVLLALFILQKPLLRTVARQKSWGNLWSWVLELVPTVLESEGRGKQCSGGPKPQG